VREHGRVEIKVRLTGDLRRFHRTVADAERAVADLGRILGRPSRVDFRLAYKRLRYTASRWHRSPAVVLWGARDVDYQLGGRDDRRRSRRKR
jgi:hypothetical protein